MTHFDYVELALCIGLYIHLGHSILGGTVKQNFATWFLWALLDVITAASIIFQHGNFTAVAIFGCCGLIISFCILRSGNFSWSGFETVVASMAVMCMIVWAVSGPRNATIAGTIAVAIATFPAIRDTYHKPWHGSLITWGGFLIVNIVATYQGKDWSVRERFYPAVCIGLCAILLALTMQKLWKKEPTC